MAGNAREITQLLQAWKEADERALSELASLVEGDLRKLARAYMFREGPGHTLQPTALVNEAFLKLVDQKISWTHRAQFFAIAARVMRQVLVDHARQKQAKKRSSAKTLITLDEEKTPGWGSDPIDLLALEEALEKLSQLDPRLTELVELRFFAGLTHPEVAEVLNSSVRTVKREWALARSCLYNQLSSR